MSENEKNIAKPVARYKQALREWCEHTSSHGLPNIVRTKNYVIRAVWIMFFLTSATYCTYNIVKILIQYFQYKTTVQISVVRDSPTQFPAVTICNLNPYDYVDQVNNEYIDNIIHTHNLSYIYKPNASPAEYGYYPTEVYQKFFTKLKRFIARDTFNKSEFRRSLGHDLETDMLLSCSYNKIACNASDFIYFWSNNYGNCYTFNSGKDQFGNDKDVLNTSASGIEFGLQLELLTNDPSWYTQFVYNFGIFLVVHNKSTPPYMLNNGINVATGFDTYIPIMRTFYKKLSKPYSNCIQTIDQFKVVSEYSQKLYTYMNELDVTQYNQEFCYKLCFQDQLVEKCDCCELTVPLIDNKLYCVNDTELACLANVSKLFSLSNIETLCHHSCPVQCETVTYDLYDHKATYPSEFYYDQLIHAAALINNTNSPYYALNQSHEYLVNRSYDYNTIVRFVKDAIVRVTVNYDDFTYNRVEENPVMLFETLLGRCVGVSGVLGGQLGLFIGMSFLSLIELLELFIRISHIYLKYASKQQQQSNNEINKIDKDLPV